MSVFKARDLGAASDVERRLLQAEAIYASTSDGVLVTDAEGVIVSVNAAFSRITGYSTTETLGQKPTRLNAYWHPASVFIGLWRELQRTGSWRGELWTRRKDGEVYLQRLTIRRLLNANGELLSYVAVFADRSAALSAVQHTDALTHYDPLTRLPNRLLFNSRLEHAIDLRRRKRTPLAVFLVDLDRFSHINTNLGHQIGDEVLQQVARRLRAEIRPADTLARLGADQFALLFEDVRRIQDAESIGQRLREVLRRPILVKGHELFVSASLGIAFDPGRGYEHRILLAHAEAALRQVKTAGRGGLSIHAGQASDSTAERQRLFELLRTGIGKNEFHLYYHPCIDLESERWSGAEARIRWRQPLLGMVPPERFLTGEHSSGFMAELGQWMLSRVCAQARDWLDREMPIGTLTVEISEALIVHSDLAQRLEQLLLDHGLPGDLFELAFSESLFFRHGERLRTVFNALDHLGIRLTLSDVGAGWMAPGLMRRLPIRTLSIHPALIESMQESIEDRDLVQALIALGQALNLDIMAKGLRTPEQRDMLLSMGCQRAQGELYSSAIGGEQLEQLLQTRPKALKTQARF